MKKIGKLLLLLMGFSAHLGLTFVVLIGRMECGVQLHCVTLLNKITGAVLTFPLGSVVWLMQCLSLDPASLTDRIFGGDIYALCIINSMLAMLFIGYLLRLTRRKRLT
jgi:hypothetical protein